MYVFVLFLQLEVAVQELEDSIPIKRLLLLLDLAKQGQPVEDPSVPLGKWTKVIQELLG